MLLQYIDKFLNIELCNNNDENFDDNNNELIDENDLLYKLKKADKYIYQIREKMYKEKNVLGIGSPSKKNEMVWIRIFDKNTMSMKLWLN